MQETKKRETTSVYEDYDRTFIIHSYDPMLGNYILFQCLSLILPFGIGEEIGVGQGSEKIISKFAERKPMSKAEFIEFQKDILMTVEEDLKNGNKTPVVRENGSYGISDMTSSLAIRLIIASLAFNFKDFFGDNPSILQAFEGVAL